MAIETIIAAVNPATGTELPIWLFIVSGVVLVGCIVAAILTKKSKNKDSKNGKRRK